MSGNAFAAEINKTQIFCFFEAKDFWLLSPHIVIASHSQWKIFFFFFTLKSKKSPITELNNRAIPPPFNINIKTLTPPYRENSKWYFFLWFFISSTQRCLRKFLKERTKIPNFRFKGISFTFNSKQGWTKYGKTSNSSNFFFETKYIYIYIKGKYVSPVEILIFFCPN